MFILPPTQKLNGHYSTSTLIYTRNEPQTNLEAINTITYLNAKSESFLAPEGLYIARKSINIATPSNHPSDPPPPVVNPLAPVSSTQANYRGLKISMTSLRKSPVPGTIEYDQELLNPGVSNLPPHTAHAGHGSNKTKNAWSFFTNKEDESSSASNILLTPTKKRGAMASIVNSNNQISPFANPNGVGQLDSFLEIHNNFHFSRLPPDSIGGVLGPLTLLIPYENPKETKRKKPKSSLSKNNSSFISKTILHENITKKLNDREPEDFFLWTNVGRSFCWFDWSASSTTGSSKESLNKILFTKTLPLCHDVNQYTRSSSGLDLVVGMSSGDALWIDFISNRYNRINKNGDIFLSAVTDIKWVPGSSNYFVTLHANGMVLILDKDREDGGFAANGGLHHQDLRSTETFRIIKSLYGAGSLSSANGSSNNILSNNNNNSNSNNPNKFNPVAVYKLSNSPLTSVVFSPDRQTLVITSDDGYMRLLNLETEVVTDIFPSYCAGFTCCAFSPDGKYLATGGKDDLVTIWSMSKKTAIARGHGHQSWVNKVEFDNWNCDEFSYRVGSVGEDGNLIFWDFSPRMLSRPKTTEGRQNWPGQSKMSSHVRNLSSTRSIGSTKSSNTVSANLYLQQQQQYRHDMDLRPELSNTSNFVTDMKNNSNPFTTNLHEFLGSNAVPSIPPVVVKSVRCEGEEVEALTDLKFQEKQVIVSRTDGRVWIYERPEVS